MRTIRTLVVCRSVDCRCCRSSCLLNVVMIWFSFLSILCRSDNIRVLTTLILWIWWISVEFFSWICRREALLCDLWVLCTEQTVFRATPADGREWRKETWEKWLQSRVNLWTPQHESRGWRRPMNNQAESEESSHLMVCLQMRPLPLLTLTRLTELTVISRFVTDWPLRSSLMFPHGKISI